MTTNEHTKYKRVLLYLINMFRVLIRSCFDDGSGAIKARCNLCKTLKNAFPGSGPIKIARDEADASQNAKIVR